MITDYSNIFKVFLPIYLVLFVLCWKCMLSTRLVSIMLFFLLTLPVLALLLVIFYYSINNVVDADNQKDCEEKKSKIDILCNKWEPMENKCYIGITTKDSSCNREIIKNLPKDLYLVSAFIIAANIFFATIKINCGS